MAHATKGCRLPLLALLALALPAVALADGGFFPPRYYEIYETEQLAFIGHDSVTGVEDLHILPKFEGSARDFAWIVPVPALPTLAESSAQLFRDCGRLTAPIYRYRDESWGCSSEDVYLGPTNAEDGGVVIHDDQLVGDYQTMILSADDASILTDSLTTWGFLHEDNETAALPIIEDYVDRSWFFVTLKIDSLAFEEFGRSEPYYPYQYGIEPIHLSFQAETIVYPMRISSISAAELSDVVLYVLADERMDFDGATTRYANRISADEMRAIRRDYRSLGALIAEGRYLTRLDRIFSPAEMDADLYLAPVAGGAEFHQIQYSGIPLGLLLLVLGAAACRFWPALKKAVAPKRP